MKAHLGRFKKIPPCFSMNYTKPFLLVFSKIDGWLLNASCASFGWA